MTTKALGCFVPIIEPDQWSAGERMRYEAATSAGNWETVQRIVEQQSSERMAWDRVAEGIVLIEVRQVPSHSCESAR